MPGQLEMVGGGKTLRGKQLLGLENQEEQQGQKFGVWVGCSLSQNKESVSC